MESPSVMTLVAKPLVISLAIPLLGGMGSGFITQNAVNTWYRTLKKPLWTPPNWVFPAAWTTLYTTMGIASYLVYETGVVTPSLDTTRALSWYAIQLGLNFAWTPLFFGAKLIGPALIEMSALWTAAVITTNEFYMINNWAGHLMVPYIGWLTYATALTGYIWYHNQETKPGSKKL